jgi:hypothetical protein
VGDLKVIQIFKAKLYKEVLFRSQYQCHKNSNMEFAHFHANFDGYPKPGKKGKK